MSRPLQYDAAPATVHIGSWPDVFSAAAAITAMFRCCGAHNTMAIVLALYHSPILTILPQVQYFPQPDDTVRMATYADVTLMGNAKLARTRQPSPLPVGKQTCWAVGPAHPTRLIVVRVFWVRFPLARPRKKRVPGKGRINGPEV